MKISEIRQQYPQYDDLSDMQLADALHEKFYADLPKDRVYDQLGLNAGKEGFLPALESSFENLKGDIAGLAGRSGLVDVEKAAKYQKEREEESKKLFQPTQKGWLEAPLTKLGELAGGSLPYMVAPAVAGALAPEGLAALGATGALSATQFTGSNLSRQVQEGKSLAQTNLGAAAAAAVPQAALDVFSLHMIPGIKGIFGKMGESITDAEAKQIAQQGLGKTIGDYVGQTGKAMGAEGLTEAGQQVFERLQAGLSITDPEARQEYLDNFIGGAALGGVLAPAGRFIERGQIKNQAAQADQAQLRQDQIEALKAQKDAELSQAQNANDPAYWAKFAEDYETQEQAFKDLQKQVKKPNLKTALPAEIAAYEENKAKLAEMRKDLADKSKEYLRIRPLYNQLQTQKKQAEEGRLQNIETQAAGIDQEAEQYPYHQAPQGTLPGMAEPGIMPEAQKQLNGLKAEQLYKQQQDLQAQRDAHQMRESEILGAGNLDEFKALREKGRMLDAEHEHVTEQLKQLGGFTPEAEEKERPTHEALQSKLNKKLSDLQKLSGEGYDPVKADKILKEINALETQLKEPAPVQQQMGFDFGERDKTPYSEPRNQTALRQQREYLPGQEINEQEQEVLDKAEQERVEGERLALIAPEVAALKRMGGYDKNNVWHAFGTAITNPNQTAVMSRTAQSLTGQEPKPNLEGYQGENKTVPTTQDQALLKGYGEQGQLFPTAPEERAGTPQRVVGASFRLFSERGEVPQDPEEREAYFDWLKQDLMTRTASALAQRGLTNEAHTVLRKAENTLDRLIETDTRDPEFLKTLDEQLKRIEQGGVSERSAEVSGVQARINGLRDQIKKLGQFEPTDTAKVKRFQSLNNQLNNAEKQLEQAGGRAVEGRARPGVGGPTEKLKTFEPNVEKRVARETDRRVLTAKPNDLALQEDLEKQMTRINEALGEGPLKKKDTQGVLFPEEQEKLGIAKETPSQFRRYMESATVRKLRDALDKDKQELDGLVSLNELKTRAEQANKEFEELNKRVQVAKDATAVIKNEKDVGKLERDINEIRQIAVKRVVDRMHLQGKLDSLKEEQRKWEKVLSTLPSRQDINTGRTFVNQLNAVEEEYQRAVNEMAELQGALSVLDAHLKVANAKNTLDKYALNPISTGELATKKQALDAANTNLAEAQKKVSALIQKNKADEAAERRRQEAIRRAEAERQNIEVSKEKQRRLERAAGNIIERVPTIDAEEQAIRGNEQKILGGYVGKVTAIEKRIKLAQDRAKEARMGDLKKYAEALENLTESYKRAKTADAREGILPRLEAAEKKYNDEADKLATEPITWIGMAKDFKDLSRALNQQYRLEERIASGEVSTTYERAPKSAIRKSSVSAATSKNTIADLENKLASAKTDAQRESLKRRIEVAQSNLRAANELKKAKEEAKANQIKAAEERLTAPNTSVEPMEEMQRAKLSKPEKTVYGKAGAKSREELREKITQEVKAKEIVENNNRYKAIKEKPANQRNAFEEHFIKAYDKKYGGKSSGLADKILAEDKKNIEFSRGTPKQGLTKTELQKELDKALGEKGFTSQERFATTDKYGNPTPSKLGIYESVEDFLKTNPDYEGLIPRDAKGFAEDQNAYLFANNIEKGQALGVLLHEVGTHIGFRNFFNTKQYDTLVNAVKNWAKLNDDSIEAKVGRAAMERVKESNTPAEHVNDELLAYAVEEAVKAGVKPEGGGKLKNWLNTVLKAFRSALAKLGFAPEKLSAGDLVNFAYGCANLELRGTWHGSDATFTAFDKTKAGTGEGTYDRRFDESNLGKGPYVTPDKEYAEYYQQAVPFGKAANESGYGRYTYQDYAESLAKDGGAPPEMKSAPQLQRMFESNLLHSYLNSLPGGGNLNPTENKAASSYIERLKKRAVEIKKEAEETLTSRQKRKVKADSIKNAQDDLSYAERFEKAANTLDVSKIKGLKKRPVTGNLYRTLDDIPRENIYSVNSNFVYGERPALDALLQKYGDAYAKRHVEKDGTYPANGLFYDMRKNLGIEKTTQLLKDAGIEAIEQKNDRRYIERAYIDKNPEIVGVNLEPVGVNKGLLFSIKPKYNTNEFASIGNIADKFIAKEKTLYDKVKANSTGLAFETQLVDRFAGFERIAKTMDKLKGSQMMYYLRMYDQRMNFVSQSAANGALGIEEKTRADGRKEYLIQSKTGPSLKSTVDILKDAMPLVGNGEAVNRLFTLYMSAIRAKDKGFSALHFGNNITEAELNQAKNKIDANEELKDVFNRARDEYNNYNRNQLAFVAQTGALSKDLVARLLKENDYIPWYRQRNGVAELIIGNENPIRVGSIAEQPYLQELVGGDAPILDFLTSSVQNTNMLADMGLRNLATKNAVFELVDMDLAHIGKGRIASPEAVRFKVDGEDRYAVINTDKVGVPADILVKGMEGIPTQMPFVFRVLGMPAKLIRKTVTASPLYAAKQLFRDSLTAPIMAGANFTPVLGSLKEINSATKATLEQRGITGGQIFTGTSEDLSRVLRDIVNDKPGWMNSLAKWEALSMEADATTRRAQYNSYIQQGLSEMEATLMSLESMNFNKRGASPSIHIIGQLIPFFNAQIQSLNVIYKALTGKLPFNEKLKIQEKLLVRGAMLAGVSLAYAAMMQDDKAYKNATPDQKYNNWFIRVPGVDEPVRLPIPFEIGYLFKALPEALYNSIVNKHGAEEAAAAFGGIIKNLIPGGTSYGIPQALRPAIEAGLGKSFYTGNDILSKREQNLLPEAQFRENTTEISKAFGKAAGVSPIKIDELVKGYTGTMGLAFLQAVSMGIPKGTSPEKAYTRLSDMPVVGGAFQPNDAGGIISNVYDRMDEIKKVKTTVDSYINQGKKAEAVDLLNRTGNDYAASEVADYYTTTMRDLTAFENAVRASNWSPEQKRQKLDQIRDAKIKFATTVREATDKSVPRVSHP